MPVSAQAQGKPAAYRHRPFANHRYADDCCASFAYAWRIGVCLFPILAELWGGAAAECGRFLRGELLRADYRLCDVEDGIQAFPARVSWLDAALGPFPVAQKRYWYFTAYFGLYFFIPALNCPLKRMHTRTLLLTVLAAVGLFSLPPVANPMDLFGLQRG